MTFAFGNAATTYAALAADTDMLGGELSGVLSRFDGMSGLPIAAHMDRLQHAVSRTGELAMSMSETSNACQAQDGYDQALSEAPTPEQCAEASAFARDCAALAQAGSIPWPTAYAAMDIAEQLQDERDAAVQAHADATSGTCFTVPEDGGWQPDGTPPSDESEDDNTDGEWDGGNEPEDEEAPPTDTPTPVTPPITAPDPATRAAAPVSPSELAAAEHWVTNTPSEPTQPGMTLSSDATPSAQSLTSPSGVYTPAPAVPTVQNQPTPQSPAWMQPAQPIQPTQTRTTPTPTPSSHPQAQTRASEERREPATAEGGVAAAAMTTTPTPTVAPAAAAVPTAPTVPSASAPAPTAPPTAPATAPPAAPVGGAGMAPQQGHGQGTKAAPKIVSAVQLEVPEELRKSMSQDEIELFEMALRRDADQPIRTADGVLVMHQTVEGAR